jgi:excisionase family DNA binding protein
MELVGYRENLELLRESFPDQTAISVEECARTLSVSERLVYDSIHAAKNPIPAIKVGRRIMIPIARLARWMCLR